jgi:hypothetical protein
MSQFTKVASILALTGLLAACQENEVQDAKDAQSVAIKGLSLSAPQSNDIQGGDIASPKLPPINTSGDYVSFITPLGGSYTPSVPVTLQSRQSDEYWMTVSGAELNAGVTLPVSQASSVIRIAPRGDLSSGGLQHAAPIAPEHISLYSKDAKGAHRNLVKSLADPQALATAGLDDDSSALIMSASAKPGQYKLKVTQRLSASARYLVNVKEKGSPNSLTLNAPAAIEASAAHIDLDLSLSQRDADQSDAGLAPKASMKHASGEMVALKMRPFEDRWQLLLPENLPMPDSNAGLSEIEVEVTARVDGKTVRRSVKTAFKPYVNSARIEPQVQSQWRDGLPQSLEFTLELQEPGRLALSAVLTGTDSQGHTQAILRTQAAAWVTPEQNRLLLRLDPELIAKSGLKPPYALKELELKDQGQMARLSYQADALILTE